MLKLTAAIDELRAAQTALKKGALATGEEVAEVREDALRIIRIADALSRTVDQLSYEGAGPAMIDGAGTVSVALTRAPSPARRAM